MFFVVVDFTACEIFRYLLDFLLQSSQQLSCGLKTRVSLIKNAKAEKKTEKIYGDYVWRLLQLRLLVNENNTPGNIKAIMRKIVCVANVLIQCRTDYLGGLMSANVISQCR